jgi:hypothetical protein
VRAPAEGSAIAVTFGQTGRHEAVARLDGTSLDVLSTETTGRSAETSAPSTGPTRVVLDGGRFVVYWTRESARGGRQVLAQLWSPDGSPRGVPLVISPADADVFGAPRALSTDGRRVVVTFAATSGSSFELRAVSLQDAAALVESEPMARQ